MPAEHELSILDEAQQIKQALIPVQTDLNRAFDLQQRVAFSAVREQLGYEKTDVVDLSNLIDTRIDGKAPVVSPDAVEAVLPMTQRSADTTFQARTNIESILRGKNDRLMVVTGPCSVHDPEAVLEYATFVSEMREQFGNHLEIVMRLYVEKPRTELGWKGFLHDPRLDGSEDMNLGLIADRMLALRITGMGVPLGRERLGPNTPQYVNGLIAYDTIGARNVQDQNARMYTSGTSSVVGLKNGTDGSIESAVSALVTASQGHSFIGLESSGQEAIIFTQGNNTAHIILRGGESGPNYSKDDVDKAIAKIQEKAKETGLPLIEAVVVDASHKNKVDGEQAEAVHSVARQIMAGSTAIRGVMIESFLKDGKQDFHPDRIDGLVYGQSITDACASKQKTEQFLSILANAVGERRNKKAGVRRSDGGQGTQSYYA